MWPACRSRGPKLLKFWKNKDGLKKKNRFGCVFCCWTLFNGKWYISGIYTAWRIKNSFTVRYFDVYNGEMSSQSHALSARFKWIDLFTCVIFIHVFKIDCDRGNVANYAGKLWPATLFLIYEDWIHLYRSLLYNAIKYLLLYFLSFAFIT